MAYSKKSSIFGIFGHFWVFCAQKRVKNQFWAKQIKIHLNISLTILKIQKIGMNQGWGTLEPEMMVAHR